MGEIVTPKTKRVTRAQIAEAVGNNPRLIKLLESLVQDATETFPTAIVDGEIAARFSLQPADGSKSIAQSGLMLAQEVETHVLGLQRSERASVSALQSQADALQAQLSMQRSLSGQLDQLRAEVDSLRALLLSMRDQSSTIKQLRADLDDLRAIQLGA